MDVRAPAAVVIEVFQRQTDGVHLDVALGTAWVNAMPMSPHMSGSDLLFLNESITSAELASELSLRFAPPLALPSQSRLLTWHSWVKNTP